MSAHLRVSYGTDDDCMEMDVHDSDKWCFCKQPQSGKVMLCCDICDRWYHSDCVAISKVRLQKMTEEAADGGREQYKCLFCKDKEQQAKEQEKQQKLREYMGDDGDNQNPEKDSNNEHQYQDDKPTSAHIKSALAPVFEIATPIFSSSKSTSKPQASVLAPVFDSAPVFLEEPVVIPEQPIKSTAPLPKPAAALMPVFDPIVPISSSVDSNSKSAAESESGSAQDSSADESDSEAVEEVSERPVELTTDTPTEVVSSTAANESNEITSTRESAAKNVDNVATKAESDSEMVWSNSSFSQPTEIQNLDSSIEEISAEMKQKEDANELEPRIKPTHVEELQSEKTDSAATTKLESEPKYDIKIESAEISDTPKKPVVAKAEADSSIKDSDDDSKTVVKPGADSSEVPAANEPEEIAAKEVSSDDEEDTLLSMKPQPMMVPPSPKRTKKTSESSSSSDDSSSDSSSGSSSDSSSGSSSDDDSSSRRKDASKKSMSKQQKAKLNSLYKNSPKLKMDPIILCPRLPADVLEKCNKGARINKQEIRKLREQSLKASQIANAKLKAIKNKDASVNIKAKRDSSSDSSSSDDEKVKKKFKKDFIKKPELSVASKLPWHRSAEIKQIIGGEGKPFKPAVPPIQVMSSLDSKKTEPIPNKSTDKEEVKPEEREVKHEEEDVKEEEEVSMEALAGLEVTTRPMSSESNEIVNTPSKDVEEEKDESEKEIEQPGPSKPRKMVSSGDEFVEPSSPPRSKKKKKKEKKQERSPPPIAKPKKKIRPVSSSDDEKTTSKPVESVSKPKKLEATETESSAPPNATENDDDAKLRLLDEDLFKKPKKKKKKDDKPALSPSKPQPKVVQQADEPREVFADDALSSKSRGHRPKSVKIREGGSGRKCIVPTCGKPVTVGGGESNFCQKNCIKRHVSKFHNAVGYKSGSEEGIQNPEVSSSQDKIVVRLLDRQANITVDGSRAPNIGDLYKWLRRNPTYEIVMPEKKHSEILEETRAKNKKVLSRKLIELLSNQKQITGKSVNSSLLHTVATDFELNLFCYCHKELNQQYNDCLNRVLQYLDANKDLFEWISNGKLTPQHLVLMTEDDFKKVGTSKFIDFIPQSDLFPETASSKVIEKYRKQTDILGSIVVDTTSEHGTGHQFSNTCKVCKRSRLTSVLTAEEKEELRVKAEEKIAYSSHKLKKCVPTICYFCCNPITENDTQLHMDHQFNKITKDPNCRQCKLDDLEDDMSKQIRTRRDQYVKSKNHDRVTILSELNNDTVEDDRLFGSGRVTGAAGLLNEVDDNPPSEPLVSEPLPSFSLNASPSRDNIAGSSLLSSPGNDDGPPPLKKVAMASPPPPSLRPVASPLSQREFHGSLWDGDLVLADDRSIQVSMLPLFGSIRNLRSDLSSQIMAKGRLERVPAFTYLKKVYERKKFGIAIVEFVLPTDSRNRQLYLDHFDFLVSKKQLGGTTQNPASVKEMYILALSANDSFPTEMGLDVNLTSPRKDTLIGLIVRNSPPDIEVSNGNHASQAPRHAQEIYKDVVSNPGKPIGDIVGRSFPRRENGSHCSLGRLSNERLYQESQSSSFPYFKEETVERSISASKSYPDRTAEYGRRSSQESFSSWGRDSSNGDRDSYRGNLPSSSLARFKNNDSHLPRRSDDPLQHLYKPLDSFGPRSPTSSSAESRPPILREPLLSNSYEQMSETDRMRMEYGGDFRAPKRAVELMDSRDVSAKRPRELISENDRYGGFNGNSRALQPRQYTYR